MTQASLTGVSGTPRSCKQNETNDKTETADFQRTESKRTVIQNFETVHHYSSMAAMNFVVVCMVLNYGICLVAISNALLLRGVKL